MSARLRSPIVVLGGGPAGALMATLLGRRGHEVTVYESRPDMRRVDISAGRSINLALARRGIAALESIDVMHRVDPITIPMAGRMVHSTGQEQLQPSTRNAPRSRPTGPATPPWAPAPTQSDSRAASPPPCCWVVVPGSSQGAAARPKQSIGVLSKGLW